MGIYTWRSYRQIEDEATNFGRGLRELGVNQGDNVVIFAETRAEWMIAAHGLFKQNFALITIYATLGEEAIIHAINETEAVTVITSAQLLPKFKTILGNTPKVNTVVYIDDQLKKFENAGNIASGVQFVTYIEVVEKGSKSNAGTYNFYLLNNSINNFVKRNRKH